MSLSVAMKPFDDEEFSTLAPVRAAVGMVDFCTREGAHALKDKIEAYWRERGHAVMVSLENVGFHPAIRAARYEVRSDMVNGMPRSAISAAKKKEPTAANDVYVEDYDGDDVDFE